jgi:hypothetical protein
MDGMTTDYHYNYCYGIRILQQGRFVPPSDITLKLTILKMAVPNVIHLLIHASGWGLVVDTEFVWRSL